MKITKEYTYTRGRQIWRLLPTGTGKLVIEERDMNSREAFYNCLRMDSGKKIFYDFQLEEKHWSGIATVHNDIIFFHKFAGRDMPEHKEIIAFDIPSQKIKWQTDEYAFDFITGNKIFCYKNNFEGRDYFALDAATGNLIEEPGINPSELNRLRNESFGQNSPGNYLFPEPFEESDHSFQPMNQIVDLIKSEGTAAEKTDYIAYADGVLLNFHERLKDGNLRNRFRAIDILNKKIILERDLNSSSKVFIPDSFFILDNLLFLLIEKNKLEVCSIKVK